MRAATSLGEAIMRYKAEFKLDNAAIINRFAPFDGVIAYLAVTEKEKETDTPPGLLDRSLVDEVIDDLPLSKHEAGFYMASTALFSDVHSIDTVVFPRVTSYNKFADILEPEDMMKIVKGDASIGSVISNGSGPYKALMVSYERIAVESISYIVETEQPDRLEELLSGLQTIGKKHSIGYGKIKMNGFSGLMETAEEIRRFVPLIDGMYPNIGQPHVFTRIMPPYWEKKGAVLCGMATM